MKKVSLLFALSFIVFVLIGLRVGSAVYRHKGTQPVLEKTSTQIPKLANGQRSLLLIGIDQIDATEPRLISAWLIIYAPTYQPFTFVNIYPSGAPGEASGSNTLAKTFRLTKDHHLDANFLKVLADRNIWWSGYIVLDEVATAKTIEYIGNIENTPHPINGQNVVKGLPHPWENAQAALIGQAGLLQDICWKVFQLSQFPNLNELYNQVNGHLITDLDIKLVIDEWQSLALSSSRSCQFPGLDQQAHLIK